MKRPRLPNLVGAHRVVSWGNLVIITKLKEALKSCTRVLRTLQDAVQEGTYGGGGEGDEEHLMSRASPGPHMSEVGASPSQIASTTSVLPSKQTANRVVRKAVRRGKLGSEIELLHSAACTHWASNGMTFKGTRARIL